MSNPQVENGYLRIANELFLAALRYQFKQHHRAVYDAILMKTYGFNKKEDDISLSQLELMTGILASNCSKACNQLVNLNVIHRRKGTYGHIMGIKKNYREWVGWDSSWEYWHKDGEPEQESVKPEITLTAEQSACWEWVKTSSDSRAVWWRNNTIIALNQAEFLKAYKRQGNSVKTQHEAFMNEKDKPRYSKKKPDDFELQDFDGVLNAGSGDFINGEFFEVIE